MIRKSFAPLLLALCLLSGCSTNEATGRSQFTGLLPTSAENSMGGGEQQKAEAQYGNVNDPALQAYVARICARLSAVVERQDVTYKCNILDSPVVNAFALPGGYININRGVLAFANSEAEVASVLAHEMGHVTARHISERYSTSALTQLGATALSVGIGSSAANQLIGMGANMYLASYTRSQETEADDLGIRYLSRAGYDPAAMASFLAGIQRAGVLEAAEHGEQYKEMKSFTATHPMTSDRVARAQSIAANYPQKGGDVNADGYLNAINGMVYGDSAKEGFLKGQEFIHPGIGFAFAVPSGFTVSNAQQQVVGQSRNKTGAAFVFDGAEKPAGMSPGDYIQQVWTKNQPGLQNMESMSVNHMRGATAQIQGTINGQPALMRLVAVEWSPTEAFRFQFAMPQTTPANEIDDFKRMSYSLRRITPAEAASATPKRISVVTAGAGDTVQSIARRMVYDDNLNDQRFRALNATDTVVPGRKYKVIVQ